MTKRSGIFTKFPLFADLCECVPDFLLVISSLSMKVTYSIHQTSSTFRCRQGHTMQATFTHHATQRTQQRGIPAVISTWLLDYGEEVFDGHGGVVRYFSATGLRHLECDIGKKSMKRLAEYMRCYLVESSNDGVIITVGKRYPSKHIWRH